MFACHAVEFGGCQGWNKCSFSSHWHLSFSLSPSTTHLSSPTSAFAGLTLTAAIFVRSLEKERERDREDEDEEGEAKRERGRDPTDRGVGMGRLALPPPPLPLPVPLGLFSNCHRARTGASLLLRRGEPPWAEDADGEGEGGARPVVPAAFSPAK